MNNGHLLAAAFFGFLLGTTFGLALGSGEQIKHFERRACEVACAPEKLLARVAGPECICTSKRAKPAL